MSKGRLFGTVSAPEQCQHGKSDRPIHQKLKRCSVNRVLFLVCHRVALNTCGDKKLELIIPLPITIAESFPDE